MFPRPSIDIPKKWQRRYTAFRIVLYLFFVMAGIFLGQKFLFPTLPFSFDFRTPDSSRNTFLAPHAPDGTARTNGRITSGSALLGHATAIGTYSHATGSLTLESKSVVPEHLTFTLRRSHQSFLLPDGPPVAAFPRETLYQNDGTYYALRNDILYPFVSETAYLTRYPAAFATLAPAGTLARYPVSETWIGFRPGTLVSFADGVFIIVSESEMRPVGSADIFLALGYRFEDVVAGSEEDLGIYKRGRIFLLGAPHPDGTVLHDTDSNTYFLIEQGTKRPIEDQEYLAFLLKKQAAIPVSQRESEVRVACDLERHFFGLFGRTFSCAVPLATLKSGFGNDFEASFGSPAADIDVNSLTVSFETKVSRENLLTLLSQMKQRFLARFGN